MTITLITGANKRLGRETARQLAAAGRLQQRPGLVRRHHQPEPDGVAVPDPGCTATDLNAGYFDRHGPVPW